MSGRWFLPLVPLVCALFLVAPAVAAPPPPELIAPAEGDTVALPTFDWYPVDGAVRCQIQVADNGTFAGFLWEAETANATIAPVKTLPNGQLWWRVRCLDDTGQAGAWSAGAGFTKEIPAPEAVTPDDGDTIVYPTFAWFPAEGATYYWLEVASDSAFTDVVWQTRTYQTMITPVSALPNRPLYWRVRGRDADDHDGTLSATKAFTKEITAPEPVVPEDGSTTIIPTFAWYPSQGATYYWVEVAADRAFTEIVWEDKTYQTAITPVSALPNGRLWWRVRGRDADDHDGTLSVTAAFTKEIPAPQPIAPSDDERVDTPTFEWYAAEGATYYWVEVASDRAFTDLAWQERTYNTSVTPVKLLPQGPLWWRVRGRDAEDHDGTVSASGRFALARPAACDFASLELLAPDDGAETTSDPAFEWGCLPGAARYKVLVYAGTKLYDAVYTEHTAYLPYNAPNALRETYANGTYTWKVEAYDANNKRIATGDARQFTKSAAFDLYSPDDGATLGDDPAFEWWPLVGAHRYKVEVYAGTKVYDSIWTAYPEYMPYSAPNAHHQTYANGPYTWKLEAYDRSNHLITTSTGRWKFTKAASFDLYRPDEGATLDGDPTLSWDSLAGAHRYKAEVYAGTKLYDRIWTVNTDYTPYDAPNVSAEAYANAAYTWMVEAYDGADHLISASSARRRFAKVADLSLVGPGDGALLDGDPILQWWPLAGAHRYKVVVYQGTQPYDQVWTAYPIYVPYDAPNVRKSTYEDGSYSWTVEAYDRTDKLITTADRRGFVRQKP